MKISDMETLLQQEMEAVHGGLSGTNLCKCESGAHVNVTGGSCECTGIDNQECSYLIAI